jgi:hypothetical protein
MEIHNMQMSGDYGYMPQYALMSATNSLPECEIMGDSLHPYQQYPVSLEHDSEHWSSQAIHPFHENINWASYGYANPGGKCPPMSAHAYAIARRNERERNRVRHINSTFENLRRHLPQQGRKRKLSKVDTLRTAIKYIQQLQDILDSADGKSENEPVQQTRKVIKASKKLSKVKSETCENNNNVIVKTENVSPLREDSPDCAEVQRSKRQRLDAHGSSEASRSPLQERFNYQLNNSHVFQDAADTTHNSSHCSVADEHRLLGVSYELMPDVTSSPCSSAGYSSPKYSCQRQSK